MIRETLLSCVFLLSSHFLPASIGYAYTEYEMQLEVELDLGVVERKHQFIFDFFNQEGRTVQAIVDHQEEFYHEFVLEAFDRCQGKYRRMIRLVKLAKQDLERTIRKAWRARMKKSDFFAVLKRKRKDLKLLLSFIRKRKTVMSCLWSCARIEKVYGSLIDSYKSFSRDGDRGIVRDQGFEKELLYVAFNNLSIRRRRYPIAYFMEKYLVRDIRKHKRLQDKNIKKKRFGFAVDLFEQKYHDLTLLKTSIECLESYNKEVSQRASGKFFEAVGGTLIGCGCLAAFLYTFLGGWAAVLAAAGL